MAESAPCSLRSDRGTVIKDTTVSRRPHVALVGSFSVPAFSGHAYELESVVSTFHLKTAKTTYQLWAMAS